MENIIKKFVKPYRDFPKPGVVFWDFTPLEEKPELMKDAIMQIKKYFQKSQIDKIAAVESKGFIIGSNLAYELGKPLVLIRKPHLIPGEVIAEKFIKEYGEGEYQMKKGVVRKGEHVLIVYDIMAGPGASQAAIHLVEQNGGLVAGLAFITELEYLHGRESLKNYRVFSLVKIPTPDMYAI